MVNYLFVASQTLQELVNIVHELLGSSPALVLGVAFQEDDYNCCYVIHTCSTYIHLGSGTEADDATAKQPDAGGEVETKPCARVTLADAVTREVRKLQTDPLVIQMLLIHPTWRGLLE